MLQRAASMRTNIQELQQAEAQALAAVRAAYTGFHEAAVRAELDRIPVSRLKDATGGRLRLGQLEKAGYTTVASVLNASPARLRQVPGVGELTAKQAVAAAREIARAAAGDRRTPLDAEAARTPGGRAVVSALHRAVVLDEAMSGLREPAARQDA